MLLSVSGPSDRPSPSGTSTIASSSEGHWLSASASSSSSQPTQHVTKSPQPAGGSLLAASASTNHRPSGAIEPHVATVGQPRDLFEVSELRAQLSAAQIGDRVTNHVWNASSSSWLAPQDANSEVPEEIQRIATGVLEVLDQENDTKTLLRRAHYGLETKNKLVGRLREEVDLFMMTPECTPALCHLDSLKEQLAFHYHRITQHVISFSDSRMRSLPVGSAPVQALCISTWAQCVGYELICELLDSLVKEIEHLRQNFIREDAAQEAAGRSGDGRSGEATPHQPVPPLPPLPPAPHPSRVHGTEEHESHESSMMGFSDFDDNDGIPRQQKATRTWSEDMMHSTRDDGSGGGSCLQRGAIGEARLDSGDSIDSDNASRRPKRAAAMAQRVLMTTSSQEQDDSDYDDETGSKKKSKYRSALPSSARSHLDNWLSSHWHDPYPTPEEKLDLADKCTITVDQVNHWFINARVRRWRPTMEKAAQKSKNTGSTNAFAALVKDCGETNPFAKFLGPIDTDGAEAAHHAQYAAHQQAVMAAQTAQAQAAQAAHAAQMAHYACTSPRSGAQGTQQTQLPRVERRI